MPSVWQGVKTWEHGSTHINETPSSTKRQSQECRPGLCESESNLTLESRAGCQSTHVSIDQNTTYVRRNYFCCFGQPLNSSFVPCGSSVVQLMCLRLTRIRALLEYVPMLTNLYSIMLNISVCMFVLKLLPYKIRVLCANADKSIFHYAKHLCLYV